MDHRGPVRGDYCCDRCHCRRSAYLEYQLEIFIGTLSGLDKDALSVVMPGAMLEKKLTIVEGLVKPKLATK